MTLKTAADRAAMRIMGTTPAAVFSSQEQLSRELADLSTEVAIEIAESTDWRAITKTAAFVGNGTQDFFPIPSDYDRMTINNGIRDQKNWFWGYFPFDDINQFLMMKENGFSLLSPGGWIIYNEGFNFVPAPTGTAQFPYVSKDIVRDEDGVAKSEFTADSDSFILSERLLTLGLIWRWKSQKGLEYGEDLAIYEKALSHEQFKDRGQRSYRHGTRDTWPGSRVAWPWPLG